MYYNLDYAVKKKQNIEKEEFVLNNQTDGGLDVDIVMIGNNGISIAMIPKRICVKQTQNDTVIIIVCQLALLNHCSI